MNIEITKEVEEFVFSLEKITIAKVLRTIDLLEKFGNKLNLPHSKKINSNIFELRISGQQNIRLFYIFYKNKIIILSGFIKKTQKIPIKELNKVISRIKKLDLI